MLYRGAPDLEAIVHRVLPLRQCIDDHVDLARFDHLNDVCAAFMYFAYDLRVNSHCLDGLGSTFRCANLEPDIRKRFGELLHFILIFVSNGEKNASLRRHIHT